MEILTEPERRRRRTAQEKIAIVQETLEPGASVSAVARRHGVNANQVFGWRKQYQEGSLAAVKAGETVVPASELAAQPIEWLTDNGSAYIDHRTRSFARELGLEPLTTPVRSPQSNGMAESFVKTMKHNYVAYMDKSDAPTALSRLAIAFEHYNERHPHKALKYRSPREFRRNAVLTCPRNIGTGQN
ncbi:transposase [Pandoraea faecigallinarum]|uniref:transposase n=1 Tax=Pandoraea faecigallinarum TaxID=656179 RepID=UPI001428D3D6|nr:transposase [Pandoraea faecigallinarum]